MKGAISLVVLSLMVLSIVSLCPSIGQAQVANHPVLSVKVPFEFVVGNRTFPAGTYKFQSLLNSVAGKDSVEVLTVRSTEGQLYQAVVTDVAAISAGPSKPRLLFTRTGGRTFLSEVWEPGKPAGCLIRSHKDQTQTAQGAART
ncbi:MAG: hypothetical protein ABSA78_02790 [Candidatus Sulfotelmatobacter sp.]|jgi:hypothetical protein